MGICRYCGQKAGLFSDVHKECAESARKGYDLLVSTVAAAVMGGKPFVETKPTLDQITTEHKVPGDDIRRAVIEGWNTVAETIGAAEPLNPDRHSALVHFYEDAGISGKELVKTNGFKTATLSMILWCVLNGRANEISSQQSHPFNLQSDELPLVFFGSVIYSQETFHRTYGGGYSGVSVRLGHGVYYHFGGFKGERTDTLALKEVDYGGLLLTTRNIYFGGDHTTFRIPYEHVVSFRPHSDGLGVFRDSAHSKAEVFAVLEADSNGKPVNARPVIGWFLFNLAHFLAQPEARTLYASAGKAGN